MQRQWTWPFKYRWFHFILFHHFSISALPIAFAFEPHNNLKNWLKTFSNHTFRFCVRCPFKWPRWTFYIVGNSDNVSTNFTRYSEYIAEILTFPYQSCKSCEESSIWAVRCEILKSGILQIHCELEIHTAIERSVKYLLVWGNIFRIKVCPDG